MASKQGSPTIDTEVAAMSAVINAIQSLEPDAQRRVINYAIQRFKLQSASLDTPHDPPADQVVDEPQRRLLRDEPPRDQKANEEDGLDGVSAVARKWMSRSGLTPDAISRLFSLGIDEIDLVATKVPGKNKKDRMRSVVLLKGVASYLGGGAARVTHEQLKETCLHYDAYDSSNFATYLKEMSAEVGGTKEAGYTLTARGLTGATELIKHILNPPAK